MSDTRQPPPPKATLSGRIAARIIRVGRRLFRNTPIQRLPIVTRVYRRLFEQIHPPGEDVHVRYLGSDYVVPTGDVTIVPSLMTGDYERAEFEALDRLLRPGMTVVDVGANVGLHAVFCGSRVGPTGRVLAFEPEPANYAYLVRNVAGNGLENVETSMKGAGARDGRLRLYLAPGNMGTHSAARIAGSEPIEVEVVRLDDFLRERVQRVDVAKVDVEGYETQVITGFMETIERDRPALLVEFSPHLLRLCGDPPERLLAILRRLYPHIVLFGDAGRPAVVVDERVARTLLGATAGSRNLLCTMSQFLPHLRDRVPEAATR